MIKVKVVVELELPDTKLAREWIKQEVGSHVLGDAMRYQAQAAMLAASYNREGSHKEIIDHRNLWFGVLDKATIEVEVE